MSGPDVAVEIQGLTKSYGPLKAVDGLSLSVRKGEVFGFLGPNGAGKTTTLKMLAGLTKPDAGSIRIMGNEMHFGGQAGKARIGYLPDVPECYGYMNAAEFLALNARLCGMTPDAARKRIDELIRMVGMTGVKKRIGSFSRGMKQRIGIAQALIDEPDVVLMDEPVSALDPEGRFEVIEILRQIRGRTTVFFSTHILSDIERVCDSAAIIRSGRILEHGTVTELKQRYDRHKISVVLPSDIEREAADGFQALLLRNPWVSDVERTTPNRFRITVRDRRDAQAGLPRLLSEAGLPLESMDSVSVSLEDVFLEVIRR